MSPYEFYQALNAAIRAGDQQALRRVLPSSIEDEHFAMLWQINQALAEDQGDAEISVEDGYATVDMDDPEDEGGSFQREFWWSEQGWLCYDPSEDA